MRTALGRSARPVALTQGAGAARRCADRAARPPALGVGRAGAPGARGGVARQEGRAWHAALRARDRRGRDDGVGRAPGRDADRPWRQSACAAAEAAPPAADRRASVRAQAVGAHLGEQLAERHVERQRRAVGVVAGLRRAPRRSAAARRGRQPCHETWASMPRGIGMGSPGAVTTAHGAGTAVSSSRRCRGRITPSSAGSRPARGSSASSARLPGHR